MRVVRSRVPRGLERSVYVWVASLMLIGVCAAGAPVPACVWQVEGAWRWVLRAVQVAGVWLTLGAPRSIDVFELAGVRQVIRRRQPQTPDRRGVQDDRAVRAGCAIRSTPAGS